MQHLQKTGGGVPITVNQVLETSHPPSSPAPCLRVYVAGPSFILRTHFQVPYPATPLFATCENCRRVYPKFPVWERTPHYSWSGQRLWPKRKKEGAAMVRPKEDLETKI